MTGSKAHEHARELSALRGVFDARAIYQYSRGCYAVLVQSAMIGYPVCLVNEEAVMLFKHNHDYWSKKQEAQLV